MKTIKIALLTLSFLTINLISLSQTQVSVMKMPTGFTEKDYRGLSFVYPVSEEAFFLGYGISSFKPNNSEIGLSSFSNGNWTIYNEKDTTLSSNNLSCMGSIGGNKYRHF